MKKIGVVTGSRAEYGLFYPVLKRIQASESLELQLIVTTMHLALEYGETYKEILADGFNIDEKIENLVASNSQTGVCKSTGMAISLLGDALERLQPDILLLLGDRFETHAAATTAVLMNIPIAHIHGGEISQGAIDEQLRHAITKMSHLHFTATEQHRKRIIQMGESPNNVVVSGAPGIDNIVNMNLLSKAELEEALNWSFGDYSILFTYHPETVESSAAEVSRTIESLLNQLQTLDENIHVLFTSANADVGGSIINKALEKFVKLNGERYKLVKSLGQLRYLSSMKYVDLLVGNTSSGIIEAASFNKPVINIGARQDGRARNANVIDIDEGQLKETVHKIYSNQIPSLNEPVQNIYGKGNAAEVIVEVLERVNLTTSKIFQDIPVIP